MKKTKPCVLITTKNNVNLFTYKKNLKPLKQFIKTFDAKIETAKAESQDILELEQLIPRFCTNRK